MSPRRASPSRRRPATRLAPRRVPALRRALDALVDAQDGQRLLAGDPLHFVHTWRDDGDREVAAVIAASLAFGRVAAFWPVLEQLFAHAAAAGGPRRWALHLSPADGERLAPLRYRWLRGADLAVFIAAIGEALRRHGSLGHLFLSLDAPRQPTVEATLDRFVDVLHQCARRASVDLGHPAEHGSALPRGVRYLLPRPSAGSACKRWCMLLRWLVRPPGDPDRADGIDLGLWPVDPARLVIPLDTHVHRLALLLGLTRRTDGSWRTALEITDNLRRVEPRDPLRFDLALAHLGISGACTVRRHGDRPPPAAVCAACSLRSICVVGRAGDNRRGDAPTG
ncbi:MAG: DUF2400 domain-containing protein [Deltaproteobacteria bacterium]|nr:MAG: DUF2400 domain-containing protein [Deltaproteobacteria bacterium]